jgi:DNA-binding NtrC family response regulator
LTTLLIAWIKKTHNEPSIFLSALAIIIHYSAVPSLLIIEDDHALGTALTIAVRRSGHLPTLVASGTAGLAAMKRERFDALILDIGLPDISGLKVLDEVRSKDIALPILVITAHATLDHAISAQKLGATQYLAKPIDLRQFEQTLAALLANTLPVADSLATGPGRVANTQSATLIGAAPCLQPVFIGIARACAGDVPAIISGPSGSGKSLAAMVIHAHGTRSNQPLSSIECGRLRSIVELDEILVRSALGTLVFEELPQLDSSLQAHLANWLSQTVVQRPRLLATSIGDARAFVINGVLKAELFYAFSTTAIPLPALRERSGDIPSLCAYFLGLRSSSTAAITLTPPALAALQAYDWPGNIRELRHVIDSAATVSRGGAIFLSHLPAHVAVAAPDFTSTSPPTTSELDAAVGRWLDQQLAQNAETQPSYDALLDRIEAVMLNHLIGRFENKPTHLANALNMNRATLRQKLKRLLSSEKLKIADEE